MTAKTHRLEDDLMRKSRPKWHSKRYARLQAALRASGIQGVMVRCEICGASLLNPQSILIHQGGQCQKRMQIVESSPEK